MVGREVLPGGDPNATLKAASWIQEDVAQKIAQSMGHDIDEAIAASGKSSHSQLLDWRLKAHIVSQKRDSIPRM